MNKKKKKIEIKREKKQLKLLMTSLSGKKNKKKMTPI